MISDIKINRNQRITTMAALLAAAWVGMTTGHGQSIPLGGFDGNQTYTAGPGATLTTGVRQLTNALQSAGAVGIVSTRIWTDQASNKELQWNTPGASTDGLWGTSTFTPEASTNTSKWVATQAAASWINFEIENTGTGDVVLDKFHIQARRLTTTAAPTGSPDTLTNNGSFANPVVYSASALTATGTKTITLTTPLILPFTASSSRLPTYYLSTRLPRGRKPLSALPTMRVVRGCIWTTSPSPAPLTPAQLFLLAN
jgi:hypothetical protein